MTFIGDAINSALAGPIARHKGNSLREERAKALAKDPALPQKEYDRAKKNLLGEEFGKTPADQICQPCMANAKRKRREERLELIEGAMDCCPELKDTADRLKADMDEVENARVAKHVYLKYDKDAPAYLRDEPPPGFLNATDDELAEMDLTQEMLSGTGNMRAAVYKKDPAVWGDNPDPEYVVAFRGSTLEQEDWDNNFAQNANQESPYYENAVRLGNRLSTSGANAHIVGHSLGGGLASAAQGGSGLTATTYNAAGLHPNTVKRYSTLPDRMQADTGKITAYRVEGEALTKTQENSLLSPLAKKAVGVKRDIDPANPQTSADDLHAMDEVIEAMEKQKQADEKALRKCVKKE